MVRCERCRRTTKFLLARKRTFRLGALSDVSPKGEPIPYGDDEIILLNTKDVTSIQTAEETLDDGPRVLTDYTRPDLRLRSRFRQLFRDALSLVRDSLWARFGQFGHPVSRASAAR